MPNFPQNGDLPINPLPIVLLLNYLLVQNLNRHLLVRQNMRSLLNLPKSTLSYRFTYKLDKATNYVLTNFFLGCARIHIIYTILRY